MRSPAIKTPLKITLYSLPFVLFLANFTEPRGRVAAAPDIPNLSTPAPALSHPALAANPATVATLKSGRGEMHGLTRFPGGPVHYPTDGPSAREVKAYVRTQAAQQGVDPQLALWIVKHESSFNPRAKGDGEASRGLWQISRIYHPEVTDAEAYGMVSSTKWSLGRIRAGKVNEWSSYRNCKSLYQDCPY
ncbi:MAG TPA: transglycosylase SLT domain-containing protein [Terriglobales bacterium]|nr:transglycosylase SLT domain-containing protein [Terriglobales bacterium]